MLGLRPKLDRKDNEARFRFGKNWLAFSELVDDDRIAAAESSLTEMLEMSYLTDRRFLDVGCGSGLFSLAARRLGAQVHSFDYDVDSVTSTERLRASYSSDDSFWTVTQGSVLDTEYLSSLGTFDIVYSWGVLHHTGDMWAAMANVVPLVAPGGKLFIALYNDTGASSRLWRRIKYRYSISSPLVQHTMVGAAAMWFSGKAHLMRLGSATLRRLEGGPKPDMASTGGRARGMSSHHDLVDWVGGYPFEVAGPGEVFDFYRSRGFALSRLKTGGACNEFLFCAPPDL